MFPQPVLSHYGNLISLSARDKPTTAAQLFAIFHFYEAKSIATTRDQIQLFDWSFHSASKYSVSLTHRQQSGEPFCRTSAFLGQSATFKVTNRTDLSSGVCYGQGVYFQTLSLRLLELEANIVYPRLGYAKLCRKNFCSA